MGSTVGPRLARIGSGLDGGGREWRGNGRVWKVRSLRGLAPVASGQW